LKKRRKCIDATVATALSLAVEHIQQLVIGGGRIIVFMKSDGEATTLIFREKAPYAASPTMFWMKMERSETTSNHQRDYLQNVGVPGTVAGLYQSPPKNTEITLGERCNLQIDQAKMVFPCSWASIMCSSAIQKMDAFLLTSCKISFAERMEKWSLQANLEQPAHLPKLGKLFVASADYGFYKGAVAAEIRNLHEKSNGGVITQEDFSKLLKQI